MFRPRQIGRIGDRAFGRRPLVSLVHTDHCGGCAPGQDERILVRTIFAYVAIFRSDLLWLMCILQFIYFPAGDTGPDRPVARRKRTPCTPAGPGARRAPSRVGVARRPAVGRPPRARRWSAYAIRRMRYGPRGHWRLGRALFRAGSKLLRRTGWDHPLSHSSHACLTAVKWESSSHITSMRTHSLHRLRKRAHKRLTSLGFCTAARTLSSPKVTDRLCATGAEPCVAMA